MTSRNASAICLFATATSIVTTAEMRTKTPANVSTVYGVFTVMMFSYTVLLRLCIAKSSPGHARPQMLLIPPAARKAGRKVGERIGAVSGNRKNERSRARSGRSRSNERAASATHVRSSLLSAV